MNSLISSRIWVVWLCVLLGMSSGYAQSQNTSSGVQSMMTIPVYPVRSVAEPDSTLKNFDPPSILYGGTIIYSTPCTGSTSPYIHAEEKQDVIVAISVRDNVNAIDKRSYFHPYRISPESLTVSPDGQYLVLDDVDPLDETRGATLFLWDWRRRPEELKQGPYDKSYSEAMWSPDSRYFFFRAGGLTPGPVHPQLAVGAACYDVVDKKPILMPNLEMGEWTGKRTLLMSRSEYYDNLGVYHGPEIDEVAVPSARVTTVLNFAKSPLAQSPDGKWLICMAKSDNKATLGEYRPCLFNELDKSKYFIDCPWASVQIKWMRDSKKVLLMCDYAIWILDADSKTLSKLQVNRPTRPMSTAGIQIVALAGNDKFLLVTKPDEKSQWWSDLDLVDLSTGALKEVAVARTGHFVWIPPQSGSGHF